MQKDEVIRRLQRVGYRITGPRRTLLDTLEQLQGHFTVEQVREALPTGHSIDLSTIYRTLELLCSLGVLHGLVGSSPTEYEHVQEPHHHLVCRECGEVRVLADHHFSELLDHLLEEHAFVADLTHLAIPGHCLPCQRTLLEGDPP